MSGRYAIVRTEDDKVGVVTSLNAHYATVEFTERGVKWSIPVLHEEYEILGYIDHKEI